MIIVKKQAFWQLFSAVRHTASLNNWEGSVRCYWSCLVIGPNSWKHLPQQSVISDCIIWYNMQLERVGLYWVTFSICSSYTHTHTHTVMTFKYQFKVNASPSQMDTMPLTSFWSPHGALTRFTIIALNTPSTVRITAMKLQQVICFLFKFNMIIYFDIWLLCLLGKM